MGNLGVFGHSVVADFDGSVDLLQSTVSTDSFRRSFAAPQSALGATKESVTGTVLNFAAPASGEVEEAVGETTSEQLVEPTVRQEFADTALWIAALETDRNGLATAKLTMPENLTTWKIRVWGMGQGTKVGEATSEVVTRKNLIVRMQAPRFFVETDEVVLSANVHNYLDEEKEVRVRLELDGGCLETPQRGRTENYDPRWR